MVTLVNRAQMTTSTTGTGTITLGSASTGYQDFATAGVTNGASVRYVIEDGSDWEIGTGTYTSGGPALSRTVSESSNAGSAINLTGSAVVYVSATAEDIPPVLELYAENPSSPTAPSATGVNAVAIGSGATSVAIYSMALGSGADATGDFSTAVGRNAQARASSANAFGRDAWSQGSQATAIGDAYASGDDSFAAAIATNSSSYGATGTNSVAIGYQAKSSTIYSIAIGYNASCTVSGAATALGPFSTASGEYSAALGGSSLTASGQFSAALGGSSNSASGTYSTVIGGNLNTSSGSYSIVTGGRNNTSTSLYSRTGGYYSTSQDIVGKDAWASGRFLTQGDAQTGTLVLRSDTTDATPEALTTDNSTPGAANQIILPNNSAYSFSGTIIARQQAAGGSNYASWEVKGALLRDGTAASTVLGNGIVNKLYATAGASAWAVALSADITNGGLAITVTGAAATNIRWVATVNTSEVTY